MKARLSWTRWTLLLLLAGVLGACGAAVPKTTAAPAAPAPAQPAEPAPAEPQATCDDLAVRLLDRGAGIHGAIVADTLHLGGATAPVTCSEPANQSAALSLADGAAAQVQQSQYYLIVVRYPDGNRLYVRDGPVSADGITSSSASKPVSFALFSPSFELDLVDRGALWSELELKLTSPATFGFDQHATPAYHGSSMATVGAINRQAAYTTASERVEGVAVAVTPIYDGTSELGVLRLYLARNASSELGYLLDYVPAKSQDGVTHEITIAAWLAVSYQPFL